MILWLSFALAQAPLAVEDRRQGRQVSLRSRQPQDPYRLTDISAYTLESGEGRIGLWSADVGVTPWLQLGTRVPMLAVGAVNLHTKLHVVRRGPIDVGLYVEGVYMPRTGLATNLLASLSFLQGYRNVWSVGGGTTVSVRVVDPLSMHLTAHLIHAEVGLGLDLTQIPDLDVAGLPIAPELGPVASGQTLLLRFATDLRFNRRDALVFQAQINPMLRAVLLDEVELEGIGPLDIGLAWSHDRAVQDSWAASLAWQFSWQNAELRIGAGWSAVPGLWAVQAVDIAGRFGGKARAADRLATDALRARGEAGERGWLHFADVEDPTLGPVSTGPPPLDCPEGSSISGKAPPDGYGLACVREGAVTLRHGPSKSWWPTGAQRDEGSYNQGARDGLWYTWYEDGIPETEGRWVLDTRDGPWVIWHPTGAVESRGSYALGKRTGPWIFGRPDGTLEREGTYQGGEPHGIWIRYAPDGTPESESTYQRGRMVRMRALEP